MRNATSLSKLATTFRTLSYEPLPTTKRGLLEKVRVLSGSKEKFEIDVVIVSCVKCQTILGIVNVL
jgi:hypothetical protein